MDSWARLRRSSTLQWSAATPTTGQFSKDLFSSRYRAWKVITLARSPVMPKMTRTSASLLVGTRPPDSRCGDTAAEHVVGPRLVDEDGRQEDGDDHGHDRQRVR